MAEEEQTTVVGFVRLPAQLGQSHENKNRVYRK
jgi:hypothetical protein